MAAELHFAEDALALHLLFQHLEGLVDIVITDENLHAAFLFDRAVDLSARRPRRSGHWRTDMHNSGAKGTQVRTNVDIGNCACRWALWPPMGRNEDFGTSPFFGQLFRQVCFAVYAKMGAPEIKNNRSHALFCRDRPVADLVDRDSVRSAGALLYLTISPVILIWQRLVHLYRV